ncbi:Uncharacterized conserved protein PhnB, glyoxalase superfamily [Muriicola jejuensis]|uniref:VOC family protein n=1 Tax=Muriicola jejuensis TaxID=504488 RepID=A0A6P0U6W7_9FLAO|nr:VOC family protein [Muriicola jejuensis]NER09021.1 VOC family protein [Muriicola jejuensis]SMP12066.1 Uncharacterized conserved protein PhnB, glyoxalase superfamily [Muriicola jejuensis]
MEEIYNTYRPEGFGTVTPYIFAEDPVKLIQFLTLGLKAEELQRTKDPKTGDITNCILRLGHSCLMVSRARPPFTGMKSSFYLYVDDVDIMHELAIKAGAREVFSPADMPYRDRQSGIQDMEGNYWWISKRLEQSEY